MDENGTIKPHHESAAIQIVITMDDTLGVRVQHNSPSGDVVEMLLYRALKYIERELTAGRLMRAPDPKVTIANSFPRGIV